MLGELLPYLPLLNVVVIPAAGWVVRALKRDLATREELQKVLERVGAVEQRAGLIERDLSHLPTAADIGALKQDVAQLAGESKAAAVQLASLAAAVTRVEDYLLRHGGQR